jgi:hypothetical protein
MKYFTPELIAAYGSDDPIVAKEAGNRWEAVCESYNAALAALKSALPSSVHRLANAYILHDAVIRSMGRREGAFVIVLQLDAPPQSLLTFTYDLASEPILHHEVLPEECRGSSEQIEWQYDEIEQASSQPPSWRQSILLSNGWEIVLHFRDVRVEEMQALIPTPREGGIALTAAGLLQSA